MCVGLHAAEYTDTVFKSNTISDIPLTFANGQDIPMGYLDALAALRKAKGFTQASLAERIGVEQPTVQRWERGKREPTLSQLVELANILGVEPGNLIGTVAASPLGPRLYVKGEVAAGLWKDAFEWPEDEWQSFTGRADVAADADHRFGLRISGDSMNDVYPPGTIVECVSTFGHIEATPGRKVVVLRLNERGETEATVKELVEREDGLWLVPRSSNPIHRAFKVGEPDPDVVEVRIVAVVVASVRPE